MALHERQCKTCYSFLQIASLVVENGITFLKCSNCGTRKRFRLTRSDKFNIQAGYLKPQKHAHRLEEVAL